MKHLLIYMAALVGLTGITSCSDWLDVSPRTEIKADDNFESEQGFKDALTGVYLLMTGTNVYGKEFTYGMTDVLAQYYTGITQTSHAYYNDSKYAYDEASCETRINSMWSSSYNVIANINELIGYIDEANPGMFTGRNYHLIRGEAYGLRAMLHFDILRLFAPSYKAGASTKAIPYVTVARKDVTPLSTVEEVLLKALDDLKIAEAELAVDPIVDAAVYETDDETYQRDRTFKFNYYAVKLLQARIYLYMGNYVEADKAAQSVIGQTTFTWVPESEISTNDPLKKNYVFSEELLFCLYESNLRDLYTASFTSTSGLYMTEETYEALYEMSTYGAYTDYRYTYQTEALTDIRVCTKLKQPESGNSLYHFRLPLMRISEAYYIAAECALQQNGDVESAAGYLNTVRQHRGLTVELVGSMLTSDEMQNEIYKEYAKEFCCEGQLFFYFKRRNMPQIPVTSAVGSNVVTTYVTPDYVLPLPDDEIEYGDRNNE